MTKKVSTIAVMLFALSVLLFAQAGTAAGSYADEAKSILTRLMNGDVSVANQIKWDAINLFDIDYSAEYKLLTDKQKQIEFQENLIRSFPEICLKQYFRLEDLTNWTVDSDTESNVLVSADLNPDWFNMSFAKVGDQILLTDIFIDYDYYYYEDY